MRSRFITLLYHDVIDGSDIDASGFSGPGPAAYKLSAIDFHKHLDAIASSAQKFRREMFCGNRFGVMNPTPILLTFDDGGSSAHTIVAPMLEARGWRAYFFITTRMIGKPGFMNAEQIQDLTSRGHIIGSHSASHPKRISQCSDSELATEWDESIESLSELLDRRIDIASIPGGFYSRRVAAAAGKSGIRILFTSEPMQSTTRVKNVTLIGRFSVKRGDPPELPAKIVAGQISQRLWQYAHWNTKKLAKNVAGPIYLSVRNRYLSRKS